MTYNVNIRGEIFGATVMNLLTGKREYVDNKELEKIVGEKIFPLDSIINTRNEELKIKYTPLKNKNINNFSFADIAYIELTRACNLNCKHCLNNSGQIIPDQLDNNDLIKLINELSSKGLQEIRFTGGEPLVYKDIYELINLATSLGLYTSIGTNATLITKDVAKKLKEAGLKKAIVSLDGTEKSHEEIRGKGTFKKTIDGVDIEVYERGQDIVSPLMIYKSTALNNRYSSFEEAIDVGRRDSLNLCKNNVQNRLKSIELVIILVK